MKSKEKLTKKKRNELIKEAYAILCESEDGSGWREISNLFDTILQDLDNLELVENILSKFKRKQTSLVNALISGAKQNDATCLYVLAKAIYPIPDEELSKIGFYEMIEKAAKQGDANLKYLVGYEFIDNLNWGWQIKEIAGISTETAVSKASLYLKEAADLGHSQAQYLYALICRKFPNGENSADEELRYCQMAAENGIAEAQLRMSELCRNSDHQQEDSLNWTILAAKDGNAEAMYALAEYYRQKYEISHNEEQLKEARDWYRKSAKKGNTFAKWALAFYDDDHSIDLRSVANDLYLMQNPLAEQMIDCLVLNPELTKEFGFTISRNPKYNSIIISNDTSNNKEETENKENLDDYAEDLADFDDYNEEEFEKLCEAGLFDDLTDEEEEADTFSLFDEEFELVKLFGETVIFSDLRINREEVPAGYYFYEVRDSDDLSYRPSQIGNRIIVNHMGTIISNKPIELEDDGFRWIDRQKKQWRFMDETLTLEEYMKRYPIIS